MIIRRPFVPVPSRHLALRQYSRIGSIVTRRALECENSTYASSTTLSVTPDRPITLSDQAIKHLKRLREDSGGDSLLLRVGVKSGGCSGMSYTMDFEEEQAIQKDDTVVEYEGFKLVTDAMSLLYLFGMTLDYSNKLIGGGFIFQNPNAQNSCGCGKSFGV